MSLLACAQQHGRKIKGEETQSQNPQVSTVARKNALLTGRNLEQDPAYREEPSAGGDKGNPD